MRKMKLKITKRAYRTLANGVDTYADAINDNVSTTRLDASGRIHKYESRRSLMNAFMKASKSKVVSVVSEGIAGELRVRVLGVLEVSADGLTFRVNLACLTRQGAA